MSALTPVSFENSASFRRSQRCSQLRRLGWRRLENAPQARRQQLRPTTPRWKCSRSGDNSRRENANFRWTRTNLHQQTDTVQLKQESCKLVIPGTAEFFTAESHSRNILRCVPACIANSKLRGLQRVIGELRQVLQKHFGALDLEVAKGASAVQLADGFNICSLP